MLWGHGEKALSMREQSQSPHVQKEKQEEEGREAVDPGILWGQGSKDPKTARGPPPNGPNTTQQDFPRDKTCLGRDIYTQSESQGKNWFVYLFCMLYVMFL